VLEQNHAAPEQDPGDLERESACKRVQNQGVSMSAYAGPWQQTGGRSDGSGDRSGFPALGFRPRWNNASPWEAMQQHRRCKDTLGSTQESMQAHRHASFGQLLLARQSSPHLHCPAMNIKDSGEI